MRVLVSVSPLWDEESWGVCEAGALVYLRQEPAGDYATLDGSEGRKVLGTLVRYEPGFGGPLIPNSYEPSAVLEAELADPGPAFVFKVTL